MRAEVHESAGIAAESVEDVADDENVDLEAVLGGNIRKAPAAATEPEAETEPAHMRPARRTSSSQDESVEAGDNPLHALSA